MTDINRERPVKLIKYINSAIDNNPLRTGLYTSWLVLSLLFVAYSTISWIDTKNHLYVNLEAMNNLVSKNTQQHASFLFYQVNALESRLQKLEEQQLSVEEFFSTTIKNTMIIVF